MDKSWVNAPRFSKQFMNGVDNFLKFVIKNSKLEGKIYCPCRRCRNTLIHLPDTVYDLLFNFSILENYKHWIFHGEPIERPTLQKPQYVRSPLINRPILNEQLEV